MKHVEVKFFTGHTLGVATDTLLVWACPYLFIHWSACSEHPDAFREFYWLLHVLLWILCSPRCIV